MISEVFACDHEGGPIEAGDNTSRILMSLGTALLLPILLVRGFGGW